MTHMYFVVRMASSLLALNLCPAIVVLSHLDMFSCKETVLMGRATCWAELAARNPQGLPM